MASKAAKWLIGCGLGCLGISLVVIVLVGLGSASLVRNTTEGFEEAVQVREQLQERYGDPGEYVPAADGRLRRERIEAFLSVREATRPAREGIEKFFSVLPATREDAEALDEQPFLEKMGTVFGITRSAFGLGSNLGDIVRSRNRRLMDVDMSLGEYTYIYVVAYASWLGHGLEEGPEIAGTRGSAMTDASVMQRVRDDLLDMVRAQLASLPEEEAVSEWRTTLAAEVARLQSDDDAWPWQNGVPEPIAESLRPFRERLEGSFSVYSNPFELGKARKRSRFSFDME